MPEDIYDQDRFYACGTEREFIWMYHNPHACSGDQFVKNILSFDLLATAVGCTEDPSAVFELIGSECRQYCSDIGDEYYDYDKSYFENVPPFAIGCTQETIDKLLEYARRN